MENPPDSSTRTVRDAPDVVEDIFEAARKKRRKYQSKSTLPEEDEQYRAQLCEQILSDMESARQQDCDAVRAGKPPLHMLSMSKSVFEQLRKKVMHKTFVECDGLSVLKQWLDPLPNGGLMPIDFQSSIFEILNELPITLLTLQSSKIGLAVYFYAHCPTVIERSVQDMALNFINECKASSHSIEEPAAFAVNL